MFVSHVTRLIATVFTGGNGVSIICQQSVMIERHSLQSLVYQSSECHMLSANLPCNSVASTETLSLAVMHQNPLSTLTAICDTDAVVLDAAVSHVTRLTATVCTRGNGVSIICLDVTIDNMLSFDVHVSCLRMCHGIP